MVGVWGGGEGSVCAGGGEVGGGGGGREIPRTLKLWYPRSLLRIQSSII